ncbi:MAG: biopolymer transport protein TolR [Acidobacteriota bacterium]|jgi:biopolymer transport protein ExbD/biopolymer transport protein TolR|nr:biopolymer transport protein TolR [Acidobacteriota bacterium]
MGMSSGGGGGFTSDINVTPMVDIMLVLLIIFMVITPFLQQGVSVALPRDMNNPDEDPAIIKESSVVVALTENGDIYLGKKKIDKDALKTEIDQKMATKSDAERIVYIRSDINANYGAVVDTINLIRDAGIDQIGLVADKRKGGSANPATGGPANPATTAPAPPAS